jgi:hypothetical protein
MSSQIQMLRLLLYLLRHSWQPTGSYVKYVIKDFKETKTYNFIEEVTIFHGSSSKGPTKRYERRSIFAQKRPAFTTIHLEL